MTLQGPKFLYGVEGQGKLKAMLGHSPDQILITVGARTAIKYSIESMTVESQFFCPSHLSLTGPLSWNPTTKEYCCVVNDNKLLSWDGEENHLEKVGNEHSLKLAAKAVDILCSDDELHILFENGSIQSVSYLMQKKSMAIENEVLPAGSKIMQSRLVTRDGLLYLVLLFQQKCDDDLSKTKKCISLFRVTVDPESKQTRLFRSGSFVLPETAMAEQCGLNCDGFFVDGDGTIHQIVFGSRESESRQVARIEKQSLIGKIHFLPLDEHYLCVLGDEADADGSIASIINIVYGIEIANKRLKAVFGTDDGLVLAAEGHLLFKHGSRVASLMCENLPSRLSDLVGYKITEEIAIDSLASDEDGLTWETVGELSQTAKLYQILPDLLLGQKVSEISEIVDSHGEIPELLVLSIIEMYLIAPDENFLSKKSKNSKEERKRLLLRAFMIPISDALMVQHLRQVDFLIVRKMLSFLIDAMITSSSEYDGSNLEQIVRWISLVLNSHFCSFILAKDEDCKEQLNVALELVNSISESLQLIGITLPLIKMIIRKQIIRPAVSQKVYNIEVVDL